MRRRCFNFNIVLVTILTIQYAHAENVFQNKTTQLGLNVSDVSPVGWGDFNNDGYVDLSADGMIWRNNAGNSFSQYMATTSNGIWGDYNNDGHLDLFSYQTHELLQNSGETGFTSVSLPALSMSNTLSSSWGDFDRDGYLDVYVAGNENWQTYEYEPDAILRNNQGASFSVQWVQSGNIAPARGVTSCDFDKDSDLDIYVSNHRLTPNLLWQNDGSGNFTDSAASYGATAGNGRSIGSAWGDLDNDGHIDLFAGNFSNLGQPQSQFLKNLGTEGNFHFEDKSLVAGLAWKESYASPSLGDYDNDGDLDLFLSTVNPGDTAVLYRNDGDWVFTDVTNQVGLDGIEQTYQSAWADYDNDGDLDLISDGKIFENAGNSNHWLEVLLEGNGQDINSSAIGTQVRIDLDGQILTRQVEAGTGQGNQNDMRLHFGLGDYEGLVDLEIFWSNGSVQNISTWSDQRITIPEPATLLLFSLGGLVLRKKR